MEAPSSRVAALRNTKYAELQKIAKLHGIKANMKAEKLVKELEYFFANSLPVEEEEKGADNVSPTDDTAGLEVEKQRCKSPNESVERFTNSRVNLSVEDCFDPGEVVKTTCMEKDAGGMESGKLEQEDSIKLMDEILMPCALHFTNSMNECDPQQAKDADGDIQEEVDNQNDAAAEVHKEAMLGLARVESSATPRGCEEETFKRLDQVELALQESEDTVDMRELVMAELETRVKNRAPTDPTSATRAPLSSKTPGTAKNITPGTGGKDWSKIHESHFRKLESLNDYLERKRKRRRALEFSAKSPDNVLLPEPTVMDKKSRIPKPNAPLPKTSKSAATLNTTATSSALFNAGVRKTMDGGGTTTAATNFVVSMADSHKSAPKFAKRRSPRLQLLTSQKETKSGPIVFKPVTSTSKMTIRFTEIPSSRCSNPPSAVKTPERMMPTSGRGSSSIRKRPTGSAQLEKTSVAPFRFDGICSPAGAKKKTAFDLQASLSKPLNYKPHKGKLRSWTARDTKENSATSPPARAGYKQPKLQTRDDRRKKYEEDRKNKKELAYNSRRGLALK